MRSLLPGGVTEPVDMAVEPNQERFAYDFELPVIELEKKINELMARVDSGGGDVAAKIERLERRRDRLLRKVSSGLTAYQKVRLARHPARPHPMDYVAAVFTDFVELHGDRRFGDDRAVVTGMGKLDGRKVVVVAMQKGRETREKVAANFGMPQPEGYRKALHKMRLAEKFHIPVVCLIDTPGAACAVAAEERGQAMAIAENIYTMAGLAVPIAVVVTGEGCSGGMLGLGVGDRVAMLENAYCSVISPEGCAAILWKDGGRAPEAAGALKLTAQDLLARGLIDTIIPEPLGGAHRNPQQPLRAVEQYLTDTMAELCEIPVDDLLEQRYDRYRNMGAYVTADSPGPQPDAEPPAP
jgi:acetyl-CoA carboxylase carboxyl transferase subunit alpha